MRWNYGALQVSVEIRLCEEQASRTAADTKVLNLLFCDHPAERDFGDS